MKKLFLSLILVLVSFSTIAQTTYGPHGASIQGRQYWFNLPGDRAKFDQDLKQTAVQYSRFPMCYTAKVYTQNRWQVCSECGVYTRSAGDMATSYPVTCH